METLGKATQNHAGSQQNNYESRVSLRLCFHRPVALVGNKAHIFLPYNRSMLDYVVYILY